MRTPPVLRCSLLALISVVLVGCAQALSGFGASSSGALGWTESWRAQDETGMAALLRSSDLDPRQPGRDPASSDERRAEVGDDPSLTLAQLSRNAFLEGECGEARDRERLFGEGRRYAEQLTREQPRLAEGHYWLAMNLAGLAGTGRAARALTLLPLIVRELETALSLDETYDQAGAHRTLGRVLFEAPSWPLSEGDLDKSLLHLRAAVKLAPRNVTNHLYLAEILASLGRHDEAYLQLELALASTEHAICDKHLEEDHQEAVRLRMRLELGTSAGPDGGVSSGAL